MVAAFIDESGKFTPESLFNVVAAITLPHKSLGRARREIVRTTQDWPRVRGELKGGLISPAQLDALVGILMRHHALLHCVGVRIEVADLPTIEAHKVGQCEGLTRHLTTNHNKETVDWLWGLRRRLELMSPQLYAQSVAQTELLARMIEDVPNYYSQRRPRELELFEWFIDAKDKAITPQEAWWKETLAPLMSSRSRSLPAGRPNQLGFDFRHFDKAYGMTLPDSMKVQGRRQSGVDVAQLITRRLSFVDSKSDVLIQAIDVLCSFLRRALNGTVTDANVIATLGRLQIAMRDRGALQSVGLLAFAKELPAAPELAATVRAMTLAARPMVVPSRWKTMAESASGNAGHDLRPIRRPIPFRRP